MPRRVGAVSFSKSLADCSLRPAGSWCNKARRLTLKRITRQSTASWTCLTHDVDQHRAALDVEGMRLILLMMPYEYGVLRGWPQSAACAGRDVCLVAALSILKRALPIIGGTDPVLRLNSLYTYRYYRIAYAGFTILRLVNAAPRARNDDIYLLSIVAALARRVIDVRLHANFASITIVLGRRLLHAARELGATRLGINSPIAETARTEGEHGDPSFLPLFDLD